MIEFIYPKKTFITMFNNWFRKEKMWTNLLINIIDWEIFFHYLIGWLTYFIKISYEQVRKKYTKKYISYILLW